MLLNLFACDTKFCLFGRTKIPMKYSLQLPVQSVPVWYSVGILLDSDSSTSLTSQLTLKKYGDFNRPVLRMQDGNFELQFPRGRKDLGANCSRTPFEIPVRRMSRSLSTQPYDWLRNLLRHLDWLICIKELSLKDLRVSKVRPLTLFGWRTEHDREQPKTKTRK